MGWWVGLTNTTDTEGLATRFFFFGGGGRNMNICADTWARP